MPCFAWNGAGCRRGRHTMRRLIYLQQKTTKRTITHKSSGKRSRIPQFYAVSDTESLEKAGFWGPKRGRNKMNNTESAGFILHQAWILHPILHPKHPINKETFKDWCRNVGEKHKTFWFCVNLGDNSSPISCWHREFLPLAHLPLPCWTYFS